jgi:Ca2+-binding EF-hand superfamily protein
MGHCTLPVTSLATAMRALGEEVSNHDAMKLALTGDAVDMQGRVAFSSFVAIMANTTHGRETEEDLLAAFKFLDKEGTGTISASRIRRALAMVSFSTSPPPQARVWYPCLTLDEACCLLAVVLMLLHLGGPY